MRSKRTGTAGRIRTDNSLVLSESSLPVGLQRRDAVSAAGPIRTDTSRVLNAVTLPIGVRRRRGSAGTCTQLARRARCFTDRIGIAVPSTLPWCDRPDSHRLRRGSRSRAASTLASTTVRPGGLAPPTTRLSGKRSTFELRPGIAANAARTSGRRSDSNRRLSSQIR
jgi:hypothetical protein